MSMKTRPWRTLLRVVHVNEYSGEFWVVIPAWNWRTPVRLKMAQLPKEVRANVTTGYRFHAQVNTGADRAEDLRFSEFESD